MKRLLLIASLFFAGLLVSCETLSEGTGIAPQIKIERVDAGPDSIIIRFIPDENTAFFDYAIGSAEDLAYFTDGSLETIVRVDGGAETEVVFEDLVPDNSYVVFARAYSPSDDAGSVATLKAITDDNQIMIRLQYLSDVSAGFKLEFYHKYYECVWYLGKESDRDAFLAGELADGSLTEPMQDYECVNYFELDPSTDYVFFYTCYDRLGIAVNGEIPIKTYASDGCPNFSYELDSDVYKSDLRLIPNGDVYKMVACFGTSDVADFALANWAYDYVAMFDNWAMSKYNNTLTSVQSEMELNLTTEPLIQDLALYVLMYDEDDNIQSVRKVLMPNHEFDGNAGEAAATVEVSGITTGGAIYTYKSNENTLGIYYETLDGAWYDDLMESGEASGKFFVHETLAAHEEPKFHYGNDEFIYAETSGTPSTKYYAVACPVNCNGQGQGWGPLAIEEYTTLDE